MIIKGKFLFLKKLLLTFIKGIFSEFHVEHGIDGLRIKLKRKDGVSFLIIVKK